MSYEMKRRKALYFNDAEFHANTTETPAGMLCVNMTVRQGVKWSTRVKPGDEIVLLETGTEHVLGTAKVFDVKVMAFNTLSNPAYSKMLKCHHMERGQTYHGLFKAMKQCYDGFLSAEVVTLVMFTIMAQDIDGKTTKTESE